MTTGGAGKDPKLLVSEGATDFERRWLSAARAEEPPPELVARIEHALGIGAVVAAPAQPLQSGPVVAAKGGASALRIAALSALGVGGAVGLVLLLTRHAPTPPVPAERPAATEVAPVELAPGGAGVANAPATAPREIGPDTTPPIAGPGALGDEIALIDAARAALAAGAPAEALSLLDRYRARHPHGMLLPEALAMRIEAIDRGGDHARARALARAFLNEYPHSPLAQRLAHLADPK
jgi:hypothetical protein